MPIVRDQMAEHIQAGACDIITVERLATLYRLARRRLRKLGYHNVIVYLGNGTLGWPAQAPGWSVSSRPWSEKKRACSTPTKPRSLH